MMDYATFKKVIGQQLRDYLPDEYKNAELVYSTINKINKAKDAVMLRISEDVVAAPTVYLDDMYEMYKEMDSPSEVLADMSRTLVEYAERGRGLEVPQINRQYVEDHVVMTLVNTESNREMLSDKPHREVNDCSVLYRLLVDNDGHGMSTAVVTERIAEAVGMKEDELFEKASKNTKTLLPPKIKTMREHMVDIFIGENMPREMAEQMLSEMGPEELPMWIITNEKGLNGAVQMLYDENLHGLSEKMGDDFFILPSSIHEVICVPASLGNAEDLAAMVQEVNMTAVALEERLSNQVYFYDKDLRKLTMATDTPNKGIDGMVAEQPLIYAGKEQKR